LSIPHRRIERVEESINGREGTVPILLGPTVEMTED
jgi:hypothetical protein